MNYKYRMHDPRIGRFFAVDPLASQYPHNSPYAFSENKVIHLIELEGLETSLPKYTTVNGHTTVTNAVDNTGLIIQQGETINLNHNILNPAPAPKISQSEIDRAMNRDKIDWGAHESIKLTKEHGKTLKSGGHYFLDGAGMIPVIGEPADALNAAWYAAEGEYLEAGISMAATIPFIGWAATTGKYSSKIIKALSGTGGDILSGITSKVDNLSKHMDQIHVNAAARDISGNPILKESGVAWDHLTEVQNALTGVKNQLTKLDKGISSGTFTGEVLDKAQNMRSSLQKQYDSVNSFLNNQVKKSK